nr:hypothetical protein [Tanacetum cinerariifolium]
MQELFCKLSYDVQNIHEELAEYINTPGWNRSAFYDDDDVDYTIAITPVLSTEKPGNSLSMGDEHLDTISATESDEVIKSSVEDLIPIPSEFEGISDAMCDVHFVNNSTPLEAKYHFEIVINSNDDISSSDDESLHEENIEYVEASPHDSELFSLEAAEIVIPEVEEIEDDNLREKLFNEIQELMCRLLEDVRIIREELAEYINSSSWNYATFYDNDEEHSIIYKKYLENSSNAIAPVLPTEEPEYSFSIGYEHPSTIWEMESDEVIESSAKNLVQIPSEYEVTSDDESKYLIDSSPKFDFLLKEFSGELAHINPILPGIKEANFDLEEEIYLVENLLYDNSSPRPPEELNVEITNTIVESLSLSHIPVEDSDSLMDEIDLFLATDDLMPSGIESDDYDSKGDIHFLEELLVNDSISLPKNKSSNFDHHDDPSFPHPPPEPSDVEF